MLIIEDNVIYLTCGDSALFTVSAKDKEGELYEFQEGDQLKFTVKETKLKNDKNPLVTVYSTVTYPTTEWDIELQPEDTKDLDFKKYYYDVQLTKVDGWVDTIIENSVFKVGVEIG